MKGIIKTLLKDKKCGFIRGTDNIDYFFHRSALLNVEYNDLEIDDVVDFEPMEGDKGPRAEDVTA